MFHLRRSPAPIVAAIGAAVLAAACAPAAHGTPPAQARVIPGPAPPLEVALQHARDLGPVADWLQLHVQLTLADRDPTGLQALLGRGDRLTPGQFAARYGPDPVAVAHMEAALRSAGLRVAAQPGDTVTTASGSAAAVERVFRVRIDNFLGADGSRFHAPVRAAVIPASLRAIVSGITGLDSYQRHPLAALTATDTYGVTPSDMIAFYDATRLVAANDGSGVTVAFIEWGVPDAAVLNAYADKFTPGHPINIQVHTDATDWGRPLENGDDQYADVAQEAALDIEIVHGIAPAAREVVYAFSNSSAIPSAIQAIVSAYPKAIISSSIGWHECEAEQSAKQDATSEDSVESKAASNGTTIYWAAGDRGAYGCLSDYPDKDPKATGEKSVQPDLTPDLTAVGGTGVFLGQSASYFQEGAWGEPAQQWGGGGGQSTIFARPSWQQAPGIPAGLTGRGDPDVSANADSISTWDVFVPARDDPTKPAESGMFGTSAAAPFWAGFTALIDQDLTRKNLPSVGFANPALYTFAQNPSGLPAPPYHDVTLGSNLGYPAGPGWDFATGLGTPDVGAIADDFEWYESSHGGRS